MMSELATEKVATILIIINEKKSSTSKINKA